MVQIFYTYFCFFKTIFYRVNRKSRVVFFSGETLLLCCGKDFSIPHNTCCAVMVKTGNAKDTQFIHPLYLLDYEEYQLKIMIFQVFGL